MLEFLRPKSTEVRWIQETLALHQIAQEFRLEVAKRETEEAYCQWYYAMAEQTRQDAKSMEKDVNFFGWFCCATTSKRASKS
jgi:hypothetical protein